MKGTKHFIVLICAIIALSCAVAVADEDSSQLIVRGENATIEEYPYMAGIFILGRFVCTGSIISSRSILTSAHYIVQNRVSSNLATTVSVGSSLRNGEGGVTHRASRVHTHPYYIFVPSPFFIANDIAIVRTISRIMFRPTVQPIQIAPMVVPPASDVMAIGWGLTGNLEGDFFTAQLQKLQMRAVTNLQCIMMLPPRAQSALTAEKVCTVDRDVENSGGVCGGGGDNGGDSGGPLVWNNMVAGVVSWTIPPCGSHPSVYVRISRHLNWIRQYM